MLLAMKTVISKFFQHNWLAILYFNFKMLPFKQAIHLPFDFYHKVRFEGLQGKVILHTDNLHRAVVKIGGRGSDMFARMQSVIHINGIWEVAGDSHELGNGVTLWIEKDGRLTFEDKVRIGARSILFCEKLIQFGREIDVSWESQIYDTNFHFIRDRVTEDVINPAKEIKIGSYNWIGNRCTIGKGTITPPNIIVASNSLLNKDYSDVPEYSMLAGLPAKVVKNNVQRLFEGKDI